MIALMERTVEVEKILVKNDVTMLTDLSKLIKGEKFQQQIVELNTGMGLGLGFFPATALYAQMHKTAVSAMKKMAHMMKAEKFAKQEEPSKMESLCQSNASCESSFGRLKWLELRLKIIPYKYY